ncbi:RNA methyltransferase [Mycoplasma sp. ATU-Cv-508]|uniref:TrmH family RNA methyltransferase n=1 Tax=Mycoplasma sp. ATU-Cv-508 TaxID=2048001 RepID=UPI0013750949
MASLKTLQRLSTTKTAAPVVGLCVKPTERPLGQRVLVLHQLQDPGNVGTLIRSALAFGFDSVIVIGLSVFNPKVLRASQGAIFHINVVEKKTWPTGLCASHTCWAAVSQGQGARDIYQVKPRSPWALILGNEGSGLPTQITNLAQGKIWVPVNFESLNVASAGAIIMSHFNRGGFGEKG